MSLRNPFSFFSFDAAQEHFFDHASQIRENSIYAATGVSLAIFLAELLVDFDNTTPQLFALFLVPNILLSIIVNRFHYRYWIGHTQVLIIYFIIQLHFFQNPRYFNVLVYWMPFISLISFFLIGIRISFLWLGITILTLIFNIYYGENSIGDSYSVQPRFRAFGIAGIVFSSGLFVAYLFLLLEWIEAQHQTILDFFKHFKHFFKHFFLSTIFFFQIV